MIELCNSSTCEALTKLHLQYLPQVRERVGNSQPEHWLTQELLSPSSLWQITLKEPVQLQTTHKSV